jgi:hypothetical protein
LTAKEQEDTGWALSSSQYSSFKRFPCENINDCQCKETTLPLQMSREEFDALCLIRTIHGEELNPRRKCDGPRIRAGRFLGSLLLGALCFFTPAQPLA